MDDKRITSVYVSKHLLNLAKIKDLNISQVLEEALAFHLNVVKGHEELKIKIEQTKKELFLMEETAKKYNNLETPIFKEAIKEQTERLVKISKEQPNWRKYLAGSCILIKNKSGQSISPLLLEQEILNEINKRGVSI